MTTAYGLIRYSSDPQEYGTTVQRQRQKFAEAVKAKGWKFKEMEIAKGISAFRGKQRETGPLAEFLKQVQTGQIKRGSVLLVEDIDRASREKLTDAIPFYLSLLSSGIDLYDISKTKLYTQENIADLANILTLIVDAARAHGDPY